jgi:hypothetical protein
MFPQEELNSLQPKLTIEIKNTKPIEAEALADMFNGLSRMYQRCIRENRIRSGKEDKLYVIEIRSGSQIYDLVPYAVATLPYIEDANKVMDFASHLRNIFNYLSGRVKERPKIKPADIKDVENVVRPVISDNSGQMNFSATYQEINVNYYITSNEGKQISERNIQEGRELIKASHESKVIERQEEIKRLGRSSEGEGRNYAFYWDRFTMDGQRDVDLGVIESISAKPLLVFFEDLAIKKRMTIIEGNPFQKVFIVDVRIETANRKPKAYIITALNKILPKE